jgi:hypothetical protein
MSKWRTRPADSLSSTARALAQKCRYFAVIVATSTTANTTLPFNPIFRAYTQRHICANAFHLLIVLKFTGMIHITAPVQLVGSCNARDGTPMHHINRYLRDSPAKSFTSTEKIFSPIGSCFSAPIDYAEMWRSKRLPNQREQLPSVFRVQIARSYFQSLYSIL